MVVRGRFITVEGGEGVGKSVFGKGLTAELERFGISLVSTREPGGTPTADLIRKVFGSPADDDPLLIETEAFLVSAARAQHVGRKIKPSLEKGSWVLSDRFADSTRLYQGELGGVDADILENLIKVSTGGLQPDLTFVLDCDVELALSRVKKRGDEGADDDGIRRYDDADIAFHKKLREGYLGLCEKFKDRIVKIDASGTTEQAVAAGVSALRERFGLGE